MQYPTVSPAVFEFSWWWVIGGVAFWGLVLAYYYRTFLTGKEQQRLARKKLEKTQRSIQGRLDTIRGDMNESVRVARVSQEAAEAAARRAEIAPDGASAWKAAREAEAAAKQAENSAVAAMASVKALMTQRDRKIMDKKGGRPGTEADDHAASARAAAERAARLAEAKGAPVG